MKNLPEEKSRRPFEKSSGGAIMSSSMSPPEMVLEEVTIGLLLARDGVPRDPEGVPREPEGVPRDPKGVPRGPARMMMS